MENKKKKEASRTEVTAPQEAKRKPIKSLREGDVSVSIWARNQVIRGEPRTFYSVTFERSYKDRDNTWRYTRTFDIDSLGHVVSLAEQAADWVRALVDKEPAPADSDGE